MKWDICKILILTLPVLPVACFAGIYSGGDGNELEPYIISSPNDWTELVTTPDDWDKHFIMVDDINLAGVNTLPVGNPGTKFTGVFDGNCHAVRNCSIYQPTMNRVGLFGYVYEGQLMNLGVEDVNISGQASAGGLCGWCEDSTIINCYTTGFVTGGQSIGGLCANSFNSTITACCSTAEISGDEIVAGLCGEVDGSTILNCYATGASVSISGGNGIGGLLGLVGTGTITNCYAAGEVIGNQEQGLVGGLCGDNLDGTIINCFWDVQTSGQATSNGGMGLPTSAMQNPEFYLRVFWDFTGEILNGTDDIWVMPSDGGYPLLSWQLEDSNLPNDEMGQAIAVTIDSAAEGTSIGAAGLDLTLNGYNDNRDVWYYFDCNDEDEYTIKLNQTDFDTTLAVFNDAQREIVFNDDFYGGFSLVILKAEVAERYYIRVAGYNGQTGDFTLTVAKGAIQAVHGDLNYDGYVDFGDFSVFANQWLEGL